MDNKSMIISFLIIFLITSIAIHIMDAKRNWADGIEKAERHHLLTGEYYNTYSKIINISNDGHRTHDYQVEERSSFQETYWEDIPTQLPSPGRPTPLILK